jgi:hypothetical protein
VLRFDDFEQAAPRLAAPIRARLTTAGLAILGTTRADGSARVSPIEVTCFEGGLYAGCMPGSLKQLDLERDGRCCLLTPIADKRDLGGGKLFAVARRAGPDEAHRLLVAAVAAMEGGDVSVDDLAGSPVFEFLVVGAAWQVAVGDSYVTRSWEAGRGERLRRRTGATGGVVEVRLEGD